MRTNAALLFVAALLHTGCLGYVAPFVAPTPLPIAQAPAPARAVRFDVSPTVEANGRTVSLLLTAFDERGAPTPEIDASCSATSGVVHPLRITGRGGAVGRWVDGLPLRGVVTCQTVGFERPATAAVDLSAWSLSFGAFQEQLDERLEWRTHTTLNQQARSNYPALTRKIEWGDGQTEILVGNQATGTGIQNVSHVYPRSGEYLIRARVEWAHGGAAESRAILTRTCSQYPGPTPIPTPPTSFGFCSITFREVR